MVSTAIVVFVLTIGGGYLGALWLAPRVGLDRGLLRPKNFTRLMRRNREERGKLLTRRERMLGMTLACAPAPVVLIGLILLLSGGSRAVGIALLILGLLLMATPISPILRAKVRRREARARRQ